MIRSKLKKNAAGQRELASSVIEVDLSWLRGVHAEIDNCWRIMSQLKPPRRVK
jgi:hypothetical protein